jgi:hypothetical protein
MRASARAFSSEVILPLAASRSTLLQMVTVVWGRKASAFQAEDIRLAFDF